MRKQSIAAALGAASLLLSGCTVGPKYQRPTIDTPTVYRGAETNGNTQTSKAPHDLDGTPLPALGEPWQRTHPVYVAALGPKAATIGPPPGWQENLVRHDLR